MNRLLTFWIPVLFLVACSASNHKQTYNSNGNAIDDATLDLTTRIKMLSGVIVRGERGNAEVTVGGPSSFSGDQTPLFILDGTPVESYSSLYSMVNTADIKRVVLLKNPVDISFYGVRGANGVIKITMKKG